MLLPIHTSSFIPRPMEPPADEMPVGTRDCIGAAVLFIVVVAAALAAFGTDWHGLLTGSERPLPESTRMMVLTPLPR